MKDLKLWIGLVVLFLSGVSVGAFGTWIIAEKRIMESFAHDQPAFHQAIMRRLSRDLSLDDSQRQRIEKIVIQTQQELRALRESTRPERRRIMERSLEAMKVELAPEQQKKLEEMHGKMEERRGRKGRGGRRGE